MTRKILTRAALLFVIASPFLVTAYYAYHIYGSITLEQVWLILTTVPQLWVLNTTPFTYLLLYAAFKNYQRNKLNALNKRPKRFFIYRLAGLSLGLITFLSCSSAIIYNDHGKLSIPLLLEYCQNDPMVLGTLLTIPFFTLLGYFIEKMNKAEIINQAKTEEIKKQNKQLQQEIANRRAREEELIEARKEAVAGVKAKDNFLSNMSHEIRTPMNGVLGLTSLLLDTELTDEQKKYASSIEYSARNLLVLINQILDLSKINSEKLTLEHIDFNVRESIQAIENTLLPIASEKSIVLRSLVDDNVPQMVCGDPVRINQILLNIIGNAIKFTNEGGVDLIVNAKQTDDGPRLSIQVNDTGIGIPKDKLSSIFDSFTQASAETTRMYGGTGLGLAISKELVDLFGGTLKVESKVGKGTSFSFDLQFKPASEKASAEAQKEEKNHLSIEPEKVQILVAEDNRINQMVAKSTLAKAGFQVDIVPNGQEVIEKIYLKEYDVILMDIQMPIMSGLDATRFIRNATEPPLSDIKIIALTASAMKEDIEECYSVGMNDHLPKPFKASELMEKLNKHLVGD